MSKTNSVGRIVTQKAKLKNKKDCDAAILKVKNSYGYSMGPNSISGGQARHEIKRLRNRLKDCNLFGWRF